MTFLGTATLRIFLAVWIVFGGVLLLHLILNR
jgi:hypothetical protein